MSKGATGAGTGAGALELVEIADPAEGSEIAAEDGEDAGASGDDGASGPQPVPIATEEPSKGGAWFPSAENVVLMWPTLDDLLIEELD